MNKKNNNDVRIAKIKNEHNTLVSRVKTSLQENTNSLTKVDKAVINILNCDNINVKQYEAVVQAQKLINDLLNEISNAKDKDEVIRIRSKINYYISKIRNELKRRNLREDLIIYQKHVDNVRKDIAKYVRYLKRDIHLEEMTKLNNNYDNLNEEDKNKLHKLLNDEKRYNTRNLNIKNNYRDETRIVKNQIEYKDGLVSNYSSNNTRLINGINSSDNNKDTNADTKDDTKTEINATDNIDDINNSNLLDEPKYANDEDFFNDKVKQLDLQYGIVKVYDYDNRLGSNIVKLVRNIPKYLKNKKIIRYMEFNTRFHAPVELISYIEYLRKRNSIKHAIKCILSKTYLKSNEAIYLNNHNECAKWLLDYCNEHSLNVSYIKKYA